MTSTAGPSMSGSPFTRNRPPGHGGIFANAGDSGGHAAGQNEREKESGAHAHRGSPHPRFCAQPHCVGARVECHANGIRRSPGACRTAHAMDSDPPSGSRAEQRGGRFLDEALLSVRSVSSTARSASPSTRRGSPTSWSPCRSGVRRATSRSASRRRGDQPEEARCPCSSTRAWHSSIRPSSSSTSRTATRRPRSIRPTSPSGRCRQPRGGVGQILFPSVFELISEAFYQPEHRNEDRVARREAIARHYDGPRAPRRRTAVPVRRVQRGRHRPTS